VLQKINDNELKQIIQKQNNHKKTLICPSQDPCGKLTVNLVLLLEILWPNNRINEEDKQKVI
jgi:hypothetical protein